MTCALVGALYAANVLSTALRLRKTRIAHDQTKAELAQEQEARSAAEQRVAATEEHARALIEKVVPLIEKTSWHTYWMAGNASRALSEENARNHAVETARKALWKIPLFTDYLKNLVTKENSK